MTYLVLGAAGFIGSNLCNTLRRNGEDVVGADIAPGSDSRIRYVDLNDVDSIDDILSLVRPDAIIQAAGVVEQSEYALQWNPRFTKNLLDAVLRYGAERISQIVILGSAAEYGVVDATQRNVPEETPLCADGYYGRSKKEETACALSYKDLYGLPVVIARIFNILGSGGVAAHRPGTFIPNTLKQIGEIKAGIRSGFDHINRLDTARDYIDIADVADALIVLAQSSDHQWDTYNIGSGTATTNKALIELMMEESGISVPLIEKSPTPEPHHAECADITRLTTGFGWQPRRTLTESIATICRRAGSGPTIPILIIGAGVAGQLIARDIIRHFESSFDIIGFVDDDRTKQNTSVDGIPVLGAIDDLSALIARHSIAELLVAIPSEHGGAIQRVLKQCEGSGVKFKILPRQAEVVAQEYHNDYYRYIRELRVEDIFGGSVTTADTHTIRAYTKGKSILVTGAAGSIGSELARQLAASHAQTLIFYDWWENGMFELRNYLQATFPGMQHHFVIGDIRDRDRFVSVLKTYRPQIIFHAAAYKHVGLMEENPSEAVKNNILGTRLVAGSAIAEGVRHMVFISSDKAVDPKSIMGTTKRVCEKILSLLGAQQADTKFSIVRFGNVMNSQGSVIPLFMKQIDAGGPVTVSDVGTTRFFMTIPEAVHLVLQAWVMGKGNDVFILDMGSPIRILDLAHLLIILRGYTVDTIGVRITGLKPGEKLHEQLATAREKTIPTEHPRIFRIPNGHAYDSAMFFSVLEQLIDCARAPRDKEDTMIRSLLSTLIDV